MTCAFIDSYGVDSYLKLRVLLLLQQQPHRTLSLDELCEQFFVADQRMLEQMMTDLCRSGALSCDDAGWRQAEQPAICQCLACLQRTFDDPLARQQLLRQISARPSLVS